MTLIIILLYAATLLPSMADRLHDVVKRSDDMPLQTTVLQLSADLQHLKAQMSALQTKQNARDQHIAFHAQFYRDAVDTPDSGPFRFDNIIFNDGNGYNPVTGIFTAPVSGVYLISAQFFSHGAQPSAILLDVKVNGETYIRMQWDAEPNDQVQGDDSDSTAFTTKLHAGDRVWITSALGRTFHLYGHFHTYFSGALLYSQ